MLQFITQETTCFSHVESAKLIAAFEVIHVEFGCVGFLHADIAFGKAEGICGYEE